MIVFAVVGVAVNLAAAMATRHGDSLNQKAVNLHMLEDVLGWAVVLIGAVVMRFTDLAILDPLMSIAVACFIFVNAAKGMKEGMEIFLEKAPDGKDPEKIKEMLLHIPGVADVHHIHIWTMDGHNCLATMHIVASGDIHALKDSVKEALAEMGIDHVTLETENEEMYCHDDTCRLGQGSTHEHCHHHHHH